MRCFVAAIAAASMLLAQQPEPQELLDALSRTAALFARTAPALGAREVLDQRGRQGDMQVLSRDRNKQPKEVTFSLPEMFVMHHVVSDYSMGSASGGGFHEIRKTIAFDGEPVTGSDPARHAMTLGAGNEDDTKKKILESLELERLQGAAADFGPILLLFTASRQRNTQFSAGGRETSDLGPGWVLNYRQTGGSAALTEFRNNRETRHLPEGQIWFREADMLPLRITLYTEEAVTPRYVLRNEAQVDYQPTRFGLAPSVVTHRQYLNKDLLVENTFTYSSYRGPEIVP